MVLGKYPKIEGSIGFTDRTEGEAFWPGFAIDSRHTRMRPRSLVRTLA